VGPPVAKPATNPWAPGLENSKRSSKTGAEPTTMRVWPKLVSCKSLSASAIASAAKPEWAGPLARSLIL